MKTILLTSLFALPMMAFSQTTVISDNFDSYTAGGTVADQGPAIWQTWGGNLLEDPFVSNSMNVFNGGPSVFIHDLVAPFATAYTTGIYEVKMNLYVTPGDGAYFNMGGTWNPGAYEYGVDVFFNADSSIHTSQSGAATVTFIPETWFEVSVVVDLDLATWGLFIDGVAASTGAWGAPSGFGVIDIFGVGYTDVTAATQVASNFFVDDFEVVEWSTGNAGIDEVNDAASLKVVPNPSSGNFVLNYENLGMDNAKVSLTNVLGQTIHTQNLNVLNNGSIPFNMNLRNGVYFVTIADGANKITKKIIVR
jgi:hypothetical protein